MPNNSYSDKADLTAQRRTAGAGMDMRGKVQVEVFGKMTLPEYDAAIRGLARDLDVEVEIFHSNIEGEIKGLR